VAGSALEDMGPADAFVTLLERGRDPGSTWPDFPERPTHFGPGLGGPSEASACVPGARFRDHWFGFTAGGRHFHADVAFGPGAGAETRAQAWAILDSLRVDPRQTPDWRATP
jgi:cation diffusion facilitator CzcD-associated flavoprotein CzcO